MRALLVSTLLAAAALLGCSPEGRCAIDSDCPLQFRCAANMCTPLGVSRVDAGEGLDASASVDARATSDTPGPDAPVDAPLAADTNADAPVPDAPPDAPISCPRYAATQNVSNVRGCTGVTATTVSIASNGLPACGIDVLSRGGNIDGAMALVSGTMTGGMTVGSLGYPGCTLTPGALRGEHLLSCGACMLTLTDAP